MVILQYILLVLGVICSIGLIALIFNLAAYFNSKKAETVVNTDIMRINSKNGEANETIDKLELTAHILKLCQTLIISSIDHSILSFKLLNQPYDIKYIKEDSERIAKYVFDAIKKDAINDDNLVVNTEFVMNYISEETIINLTYAAKEYNSSLNGNVVIQ